jgi:hypothetical protein
MPTVTTAVEAGYAHCTNPRCPGHDQVQVQIVKTETSFTYAENGGNFPGVERSHVLVTFADEADAVCRYCRGHREATDQPRKQYAPLSGYDPKGLLQVARFDAELQRERLTSPVADAERAEFEAERELMRRQMLEMQQQMAQLIDAVQGKAMDPPVLNGLENVVNTTGGRRRRASDRRRGRQRLRLRGPGPRGAQAGTRRARRAHRRAVRAVRRRGRRGRRPDRRRRRPGGAQEHDPRRAPGDRAGAQQPAGPGVSRKTLDIRKRKGPIELGELVARQLETGATQLRARKDQRDELLKLFGLSEPEGGLVWNGMEIVT